MLVLKQSFGGAGTFSILEKVNHIEKLFPNADAELRRKVHFLPKELIDEMKDFTERNALVVFASRLETKEECWKCCERCLKAHVLEKCKKLEVGEKIRSMIDDIFGCEAGHDGYYLDGDVLVKISKR